VLSVAEALGRILAGLRPLGSEQVAVSDALGRVLAEDVTARVTQPPAAVSAMDGYAVRAADVAAVPARLAVIGEVPAGRRFAGQVGPGETVRIFTGAPLPAGADTNADLHGRKAGYPNWPSDRPDVMSTALYFDTVNFASRIQAPVFAGMGFIDTISPPAGVWTALNQIPAPKEPLPMIESEHDNLTPEKGRACPARTKEILDLLVHVVGDQGLVPVVVDVIQGLVKCFLARVDDGAEFQGFPVLTQDKFFASRR
jgi:hypothetical protein